MCETILEHIVIAESKQAIEESGQKDTRFLWPKMGLWNIDKDSNCKGFKRIQTYLVCFTPFIYKNTWKETSWLPLENGAYLLFLKNDFKNQERTGVPGWLS